MLENQSFVLALGRLVFRKGFDLANDAFCQATKADPSVQLVIAGSGPELKRLESQAAASGCVERIKLLGSVSEDEKRWLLARSLFLMMPNRPLVDDLEGFGIVFIEAAWYSKPAIGGNNGGVPDAIAHKETGFCVESPDVAVIADAMRRLLKDDDLRRRMGRAALDRVKAEFLWSVLGDRFIRTMKTILEQPS